MSKSFSIPTNKVDSLKERASHPFAKREYRELKALHDVSFDVHKGEFFGIVGRNGSGKSSLLKILASIYKADAGTVRMAGRLAPFIELGVGFNMELTARENSALNGVLMGLTLKESRYNLDAVLDFAELDDFVDLKLKNYSSGMMVRLAFSVMARANADIMLIDEVLAVGDAAFAQKCMDVFRERRNQGTTIVLVTHDMITVQDMCDRAMLIHDGDVKHLGSPAEAALKYFRLNFAIERRVDDKSEIEDELNAYSDDQVTRVIHARVTDEDGVPVENVEQGTPIRLDVVLETRRELVAPRFVFNVLPAEGPVVFEIVLGLDEWEDKRIGEGKRVQVSGPIDNPLVPGRYIVDCWIRRDGESSDMGIQGIRLFDFVVFGTDARHGVVTVDSQLAVSPVGELAP